MRLGWLTVAAHVGPTEKYPKFSISYYFGKALKTSSMLVLSLKLDNQMGKDDEQTNSSFNNST